MGENMVKESDKNMHGDAIVRELWKVSNRHRKSDIIVANQSEAADEMELERGFSKEWSVLIDIEVDFK